MISESRSYYAKVDEYFEALQSALDAEYFEKVTNVVAKLSNYVYMFNQDQQDTYEEAVDWLEDNEPWDDDQPDEAQEWYDFDPDC